MQAYSLDFREKIIDVHFMEGVSVRKVAKRFGVAKSFVETLLKQLRETGDILPKPHGGGPQPKLNGEQLQLVRTLVEADNDATLEADCLTHLYAASQGGSWHRKDWILENQMRS